MLPLGLLLLLVCCGAARGNLSRDESQPTTSDETVVTGGTVVLKCQVEDPDDSSLQWSNPAQQTLYFGEKRALRDNRIQLEKSTPNELTISISDVVLSDEGEYTCSLFTMPVRTAKALVTVLGVPQKPQIFGHEQPIDEEKLARLTCRSSGSKPAAQLRWRKGNKELKDEGTEVVEDPNGKTFTVSSRVEFRVTKEDNEAEVTCTVDHESLQNAERSTTQKLQVHYKPTAKIEPHPQYPREGEKLQLQCDGQGNPIPQEFLWEKEGSDAPLQLSSDSVLIFPFLNKSDSGTYVCTATSSMGSVVAKYNLDVSDLYRKVFVFRNDPSDAYVVLRLRPEQPLLNFTVCLRSYTHLTRPHSLFSYATKAQDNEILLLKPKPGEYRFYVGGKFVTFRTPENRGDWEHVCARWESGTGVAEFWLDGKPWPRKGLQRGYAVGPEAAVLLGQEQDAFGGGFDLYNSFSGELADVYLWDTVLSPDRMRAAFQSLRLPPALLAWSSLSYSIKGDVVVKPRLRAALGA
ncbi:cell adhesion molecule 3-like isoform X7 [Melopsittacus undulatus]|uniref:cell adhesion molecule 3-like isoform X7 n=1 Tax=Melopsittacus undulatus TaxID=13146 RepID=UPI00146E6C43|nr:cell adhesion molecule 3-like isoform X7 [Melopsittacus undulatus]